MALTTEPRTTRAGVRTKPVPPATGPTRGLAKADATSPTHGAVAQASPGRTWARRYAVALSLSDLLAIALAAAAVHLVHLGEVRLRLTVDGDAVPYIRYTIVLVVAWMIALHWIGSRSSKVIGVGPEEFKRVINGSFAVFGLFAIGSFILSLDLPRSYLLVMLPTGLALILAERYAWRRRLHRSRRAGKCVASVLAVGSPRAVKELIQDLGRAPWAGYAVVGACTRLDALTEFDAAAGPEGAAVIDGVPVLGGLDAVADVVSSGGFDTVAITASAEFGPSQVRALSWKLEPTGVSLILAPALTNIAGPRVHTQPVAGLPLIHVDHPTYRGANQILKRSFDIVCTGMLVAVLSPLLLLTAAAVRLTSRGPVFFRQERIGLDGRTFRMIKFRSMVVDAEARLAALAAQQRDAGNEVLFKIKHDPRITRVGRVIRRFSLDELPQLFNVLFGQMSLVGPRPPLAAEVEKYGDDARRRLLVKPGITGLWQVSGRSDLSWDESVRLDLYYVENWSLTGDLAILWRTARAVVSSSGAY